MFVEDVVKKKVIVDVYLVNVWGYFSGLVFEYFDGDICGEWMGWVCDLVIYFVEYMYWVLVLLIFCLKGWEDELVVGGVLFWVLLFLVVWSFCLVLCFCGLGLCWMMLYLFDNGEYKVVDVFGIFYDEYS